MASQSKLDAILDRMHGGYVSVERDGDVTLDARFSAEDLKELAEALLCDADPDAPEREPYIFKPRIIRVFAHTFGDKYVELITHNLMSMPGAVEFEVEPNAEFESLGIIRATPIVIGIVFPDDVDVLRIDGEASVTACSELFGELRKHTVVVSKSKMTKFPIIDGVVQV